VSTGHGGLAERIATRLARRGAHVDICSVGEGDDLEPYGAVVLGSAVYGQSWISSAIEFVRRNAHELADREAVHPRDYRVFAGAIERQPLPFTCSVDASVTAGTG
jgi:hypothetical protein